MLSRRDKLLVQPWQERRYRDHRAKVESALPAIDARSPAARPHVALKLKKCQRERQRAADVRRENFALLQRLAALMRTSRLDNRWAKPPRNFQHKVGQYHEAGPLRARLAARAQPGPAPQPTSVKCYACDHRKTIAAELPSIY